MALIGNGYAKIREFLAKKSPQQALVSLESLKQVVEFLSKYGEQRECEELIDAINLEESKIKEAQGRVESVAPAVELKPKGRRRTLKDPVNHDTLYAHSCEDKASLKGSGDQKLRRRGEMKALLEGESQEEP